MNQKNITPQDVVNAFGRETWTGVTDDKRNYQVLNFFCSKAAQVLAEAAPALSEKTQDVIRKYPYMSAGICARGMAWAFAPGVVCEERKGTIEAAYDAYFTDVRNRHNHDFFLITYPQNAYTDAFALVYWPSIYLFVILGVVYEFCYLLGKNYSEELKSDRVQELITHAEEWTAFYSYDKKDRLLQSAQTLKEQPAPDASAHRAIVGYYKESLHLAEELMQIANC